MSDPEDAEGPEGTTRRMPVIEKDTGPADGQGRPDQSASAAAYDAPPPGLDDGAGGSGRFWSSRRVPAGLVALLLLAGTALLLYDVMAVRFGRPAMGWRRALARQLAERQLDDVWVLVGAGVAVALGLWLVVLAATPGLRRLLPMLRPHADVRAGLHRDAVALVLRDRAMEVTGVQSARVRMRRSRADVRAVSHFRALDDVRHDLDDALAGAVRELGLVRPPALSVHVRRTGRKKG